MLRVQRQRPSGDYKDRANCVYSSLEWIVRGQQLLLEVLAVPFRSGSGSRAHGGVGGERRRSGIVISWLVPGHPEAASMREGLFEAALQH